MKKIGFYFILLIFLQSKVSSQTSFEFGIDTEDDCYVTNAAKDNNGNTIILGVIGPFIGYNYDAYLLKVFPDGNYIEKRFDLKDTISVFTSITILDNGNYFLIGSCTDNEIGVERENLWILILDQDLTVITSKFYKIREPYLGFGTSTRSVMDNDGNIIFAATALEEMQNYHSDFAFYKFNQQGDTLLSKYHECVLGAIPYDIRKTPDSDNLMLIERSTHYNNHTELMFINTNLDILKINQLNTNFINQTSDKSSDCWVTDTSFLLSGYSFIDNSDACIGVALVDTTATYLNQLVLNKIDTTDYPARKNSMAYANDSTIYIGGFQCYLDLWTTEPTIVELYVIDKNMNLLGYQELGGDKNYELWGIIATDDDGCLLYGTSYTNGTVAERDVHIWKVLRDTINITTEVTETRQTCNEILIYPNPVNKTVNISLPANRNWNGLSLTVYSLAGKKVFQKKITQTGNLLEADIGNLKKGMYIIQVTKSTELIYSKKIVKN